jgi:pSer/pThr/pTyr-binding forkhead associated (FHA) protein
MDSTPALAPYPELILRNGRQKGARRALKTPITFIGRENGCDIQLTVDGIQPIHCVIAVGPERPVLRAWNGAQVLVNGSAVMIRELHDGDVVALGPFEFEMRGSTAHLTARKETEAAADTHAKRRLDEIRELQRQLSEARAEFRRDRKARQLRLDEQSSKLTAMRAEVEKREELTRSERARLLSLRKRFIRRWKKHWSSERGRLEKESQRLQRERADLAARLAELSTRDEQLRTHGEVEQRRIDEGWRKLNEAAQTAQIEQAQADTDLTNRRHSLAEDIRLFDLDRHALVRERLHVEQYTAQLRIEASGLDSRIANLRAVLAPMQEQYEAQMLRALTDLPEPPATVPAAEQRLAELERLIADVGDQRRVLLDQTDQLGEARAAWRDEEQRLVGEMEKLGRRLKAWEDRLIQREKRAVKAERSLEIQRANLEQSRERLDSWQARLQAREVGLREENLRLESELRQRLQQVERRDSAMSELCRRWCERRRTEVQHLRTEHRRCAKLRMAWQDRRSATSRGERNLLAQQRELAVQALVLENAGLRLLTTARDPRVAAKKFERIQRRIDRVNAREKAKLEENWLALRTEQEELEVLFNQTMKQVEQAAQLERAIADRLAEAESRERRLTEREVVLLETETQCKAQRESYQRECGELRDEIDRLAGLLIERGDSEPLSLARAA